MRTRETKKLVEQTVTVYIAVDGKEFATKKECEDHEALLENKALIEKVESLRLRDLDGEIPLDNNGYANDNNNFAWYNLSSFEDFKLINTLYDGELSEPLSYPEIVCVESNDWRDEYTGDFYDYHFCSIKCATIEFYEKFGYKVTFEKIEEV